jgi:hypothetical protein
VVDGADVVAYCIHWLCPSRTHSTYCIGGCPPLADQETLKLAFGCVAGSGLTCAAARAVVAEPYSGSVPYARSPSTEPAIPGTLSDDVYCHACHPLPPHPSAGSAGDPEQ